MTPPRCTWLRAAVLLCTAALAHAGTVPFFGNATSISVCTSEYAPMVYCEGREGADYSGYEIELFRKTAEQLNWTASMMTWKCMDWDVMLDHLKAGDGVCDVAVAGIGTTTELIDAGVSFSWPTYRNGLKIMTVYTEAEQSSIWSFFDAFTTELWIIIVATAIGVAVIVWAMDVIAVTFLKLPGDVKRDEISFQTYLWESLNRPTWARAQESFSLAGNIVILGFSFQIMVLFAIYLGSATAALTASILDNQITGISDLPGKAVGTDSAYVSQLGRYGIAATSFPWNNLADEEAMYAALRTGEISALVLDGTTLDFHAASNCEFTVLESAFDNFDQATAFPAGFDNPALLDAYNIALERLQEAGASQEVGDAQLLPTDGTCAAGSGGEVSSAITFRQVTGLWILLAAATALALLLVVAHQLYVRYLAAASKKTIRAATRVVRGGDADDMAATKQAQVI